VERGRQSYEMYAKRPGMRCASHGCLESIHPAWSTAAASPRSTTPGGSALDRRRSRRTPQAACPNRSGAPLHSAASSGGEHAFPAIAP
jgi:hypothetical protein